MPKVISEEKRNDIVFHKERGVESKKISVFLRVTTRVVDKIWEQYQKTGNTENKIHNCGRKSVISKELERKIIDEIKKTPDKTLLELINEFKLPITEGGLSKWLCKRGYTFKKRQLIQPSKNAQTFKKKEKSS